MYTDHNWYDTWNLAAESPVIIEDSKLKAA
jgi:hypothetical protein